MALGGTDEGALFVSLDDFDNISILLDEDNDLKKEIPHLFNEVFLVSILKKKPTKNQALNIRKTCTVIRGNLERFQVCFLV